jgi:hypothetical protein
MNTVSFRIMEGGLCDVPIYEEHPRGRNWCATITPNPTAPGGMDRNFWPRARKNAALFYYIVPPELHPPCIVEFGADYVTGAGRKHPKRWYGVLVEHKATKLVVTECAGPREAFDLCDELVREIEAERATRPPVTPFVSAAPEPPVPFVSAAPEPPAPSSEAVLDLPAAGGPETEA